MKSYKITQKNNKWQCISISFIRLWCEGVFVVFYFWFGVFVEDNRNDVEAKGAVFYIISCEEIAGGSEQSGFFGSGDGIFGGGEIGVGFCSYLDEYNRGVSIDHDQVEFAGFAGEVACEGF